jgi:hypothetical protein
VLFSHHFNLQELKAPDQLAHLDPLGPRVQVETLAPPDRKDYRETRDTPVRQGILDQLVLQAKLLILELLGQLGPNVLDHRVLKVLKVFRALKVLKALKETKEILALRVYKVQRRM